MPVHNAMPILSAAEQLAVRLLRCWSMCRRHERPALPTVSSRCLELDISVMVGVAFTSLFQLYEQCLRRPLRTTEADDGRLAHDEIGLLRFLRQAPELEEVGGTALPAGLKGALILAAASVRRMLWNEGGCAFPSGPSRMASALSPSLAPALMGRGRP